MASTPYTNAAGGTINNPSAISENARLLSVIGADGITTVMLNADSQGNLLVTLSGSVPSGSITPQVGQVKVATAGTAVQLNVTSYVIENSLTITANINNSGSITVGFTSGVNNTITGAGNGYVLAPGASCVVAAGINIDVLYINGTSNGDWVSYVGA